MPNFGSKNLCFRQKNCEDDSNAFSKKIENHMFAVALYFMHYNFARPHKTLANPYPRTPVMAAGISDHIWTIEEIVKLVY